MSNKKILLPLPLGGAGLGLLNTLVEGSKALTRDLPIRVSSTGFWCGGLHSSSYRDF